MGSPVLEWLMPHVAPFVLVLSRVGGLFMFTPLLSSGSIPTRVKVMLALALTLVLYPTVEPEMARAIPLEVWSLVPAIATEVVIGMALGIFAAIPLMTVQLAGLLMGQQMGLAIASVLNPNADIPGDNLGQMLFLMTLVSWVYVGGLELLVGALAVTFDRVALGGFAFSDAPLWVLSGLMQSGYELALRMAMPVLLIIFVENVALAFIMKTVPSLNIMTFGFPLRIILGLFVFIGALEGIRYLMMADLWETHGVIDAWVMSLGAGEGE